MTLIILGALLVLQFLVLVALGHEIRTRREQVTKLGEAVQQAGAALRSQNQIMTQMNTVDTLLARGLSDIQKQVKNLPLVEDSIPTPDSNQLH